MKRKLRTLSTLLGALLALSLAAGAPEARGEGWVVEMEDPDFPGERTTFYLLDGRARVEGLVEGLVFLLDLPAGEGRILDGREGLWAGGTLGEIGEALRGAVEDGGSDGETEEAAMPPVRAELVSPDEEVQGLRAARHRVYLGDLLVEDLWVSPDLAAAGEGGALFEALETMTGGGALAMGGFPGDYEGTEEYRRLLRGGFPVRRVRHYRGVESVEEVRRASRRDIGDELFAVPGGFTKAGYLEVFFGGR